MPELHFVVVSPNSARHLRHGQGSRKAKAHTANVNWRRHKKASARQGRQSHSSGIFHAKGRSAVDDGTDVLVDYETVEMPVVLSKPVSPVFGALSVSSFGMENQAYAAASISYHNTRILNGGLPPADLALWFEKFCQSPLAFHTLCYIVSAHQQAHRLALSTGHRQRLLSHRINMIQIINAQLSDLSSVDIDPILLAMSFLWRLNPADDEKQQEAETKALMFSPHLSSTNWASVSVRSEVIDAHAAALQHLVNRIGGLKSIKWAGLAPILANADLMESSARLERPMFGCIFHLRPGVPKTLTTMGMLIKNGCGRGFGSLALPSAAKYTFQLVAAMDCLLDSIRDIGVDHPDFYAIVDTRKWVQYQLLSLPREGDQLYELCRVTALLYSNSVLFPIGLRTGWHLVLLSELEMILSDWRALGPGTEQVSLWSLIVGSIAAYSTEYGQRFIFHLRPALQRKGRMSWSLVHDVLKQFLWQDSACSLGAAALWRALEVDEGY